MTKITTTVRVYPEDAKRLDALRRWLQANNGGEDCTISDAVKAAIDAWEREPIVYTEALDVRDQLAL